LFGEISHLPECRVRYQLEQLCHFHRRNRRNRHARRPADRYITFLCAEGIARRSGRLVPHYSWMRRHRGDAQISRWCLGYFVEKTRLEFVPGAALVGDSHERLIFFGRAASALPLRGAESSEGHTRDFALQLTFRAFLSDNPKEKVGNCNFRFSE